MDKNDGSNMKEGIATRVNLEESDAKYVAATFRVLLRTVGDLRMLIKCIEDGKHDELLSRMTNDDCMAILDALGTICNSIKADNTNANVIPCKVSHVDDSTMAENLNFDDSTLPSDPIVQSVDINTKSTSYARAAGASTNDQPKVNSNFCPLVADPVFDGVNIFIPCKVVKKAKHGLKRITINSKGFFFFKFDLRAGLEAVLEGGPWLIRKSLIILKKWSMDTRFLKEELTRILIWVKLHDVPIQVFEASGISLIAMFIGKPVILNSYISSMCNYSCDLCKIFGHVYDHCPNKLVSPPIVTTSNVVTPIVEKKNDGFQMVKQNVRYEPKVTASAPKKGATNVGNPSTSSSMLKTTEEEEEDVVNVYDETANLSTKTDGSSPFTPAVG
nr:hypothetical protein [Tanacetum cinerariifolium]